MRLKVRKEITLTDKEIKKFKIKYIQHSTSIFTSAVLVSKDKRYIIDTRTSELFDTKTGKCFILSPKTAEDLFLLCRYNFVLDL